MARAGSLGAERLCGRPEEERGVKHALPGRAVDIIVDVLPLEDASPRDDRIGVKRQTVDCRQHKDVNAWGCPLWIVDLP